MTNTPDIDPAGRVDLHCHSTFSDGTLTPTELAAEAKKRELVALALTDHDNLNGWSEFRQACEAQGIEPIPAVEISSTWTDAPDRPRTIDVLGYFVDPDDHELTERLAWMLRVRRDRNGMILEKLNELGCPISREELAAEAGSDVIGRPHFASAMLKKGYVKTRQQAFDKYLADGAAAHVPKARILPTEAIALIRAAGGCPVLAHPGAYPIKREKDYRALIEPMVEAGLTGIETYYPGHTAQQRDFFYKVAKESGLVPTGGSDFHGENRPDIYLGKGDGTVNVMYETVEALKKLKPTPVKSRS
jgi:predicted metal-dependent phosphoesterase TrpH